MKENSGLSGKYSTSFNNILTTYKYYLTDDHFAYSVHLSSDCSEEEFTPKIVMDVRREKYESYNKYKSITLNTTLSGIRILKNESSIIKVCNLPKADFYSIKNLYELCGAKNKDYVARINAQLSSIFSTGIYAFSSCDDPELVYFSDKLTLNPSIQLHYGYGNEIHKRILEDTANIDKSIINIPSLVLLIMIFLL